MIQLLMANLNIDDDIVIHSFPVNFIGNELDKNSAINTALPTIVLKGANKKRLKSDNLSGVVAEHVPVSATVIIIQELNGIYTEVGRTNSSDGSWEVRNLPYRKSIAIALKDTYNAGVVSGLYPKD